MEKILEKVMPLAELITYAYVVLVGFGLLAFIAVAIWVFKGLRDFDKDFDKF